MQIRIVPYTDAQKTAFADIFIPWLTSMTGKPPEPEDVRAVTELREFYIDPGGMVFYAYLDDKIIGCIAVRKLSVDIFEFCKLVVLDEAKGLGIGKRLVQETIDFARSKGGKLMALQSFKRLELALGMYKRMGFADITPPAQMNVLSRTEVVMGLKLAS